MIQIAIDEKACVSCGLCVDTCPTEVFQFDTGRDLAQVAKPAECFGCLSCSEICPASAISHEGVSRSRAFYHDPYALEVARKLSTNGGPAFAVIDDQAGRGAAMGDLGVRLRSVGAVLKDIVGTGLAPVGMMAGRALATQLPRYQPPSSLDEALELAKREFAPAWELGFQQGEGTLRVDVGACAVRELCTSEKIPLGGELCVLFFHYMAGYLNRMAKTQLRLGSAQRAADRCAYEVKILR